MKQRLQTLAKGPVLLLYIAIAVAFTAGMCVGWMFLANWLFSIGWWWFAVPARILEWITGIGAVLGIIALIVGIAIIVWGLLTGKEVVS